MTSNNENDSNFLNTHNKVKEVTNTIFLVDSISILNLYGIPKIQIRDKLPIFFLVILILI